MWGLPHNMPSQAARGFTLVPPPVFFHILEEHSEEKKLEAEQAVSARRALPDKNHSKLC